MSANKYSILPGKERTEYFGFNPLGKGLGVIRKMIKDFSQEELEGWLRMNPKTARQFVAGPEPAPLPVDNQPGAPLPKAPGSATQAADTGTSGKGGTVTTKATKK